MNDTKQNFLDSKTLLAVVLVGFSWMGWQWYMQSKYPKAPTKVAETRATEATAGAAGAPPSNQPPAESWSAPALKVKEPVAGIPETMMEYSSPTLSFQISSHGMGLKQIRLGKYLSRDGSIKQMGLNEGDPSFETGLIGQSKAVDFKISRVDENTFKGVATVEGAKIEKTIHVQPEAYSLQTEVVALAPKDEFRGFTTTFADQMAPAEKRSFLLPALDHHEFYLLADGSSQRVQIANDKDVTGSYAKNLLVSIGSQYFVQALVNRASTLPEVDIQSSPESHQAMTTVKYPVLNRGADFEVKYLTYVGPKSLTLLKSLDEDLAGVINFGMFSFIAHYLLKLMIWFHEIVGNWGITIILLTIVVRLLVLPFNVMSYKSMKAMQTIQPQLKELREKHKDDSQRLSLETMNLMKTQKVNPLGGCLPLLLQFPIFLALYQVLGQSIELYQAPFGLWIHDLSLKDPYYVLPVLMGMTLFVQQRVTPNTMDPAQRKILMFMPLLFSLFMVSLPSGLTLYIFVSGLFGVTQQLYFMRDRNSAALAKT